MKQKHFLTSLIASLALCATSVFAQTIHNTSERHPGWLWTISGNGLTQKSYLFGTCHGEGHNFTPEEVFGISGLEATLCDVKMMLFEGGMNPKQSEADSLKNAEETTRVMNSLTNPGPESVMPEGVSYESLFDSVKHFKAVDKLLTGLAERLNVGEYQKRNPRYWCSWLILTQVIQWGKSQRGVMSVDAFLSQEAQRRGLEIGYVEGTTAGNRIFPMFTASLDTLSIKQQAGMLYVLLENMSKSSRERQKKMAEEMTKNYLMNDTCLSEHFWREQGQVPGSELSDDSHKEIVYDRNVAWIPVIQQHITRRPCLIAVGYRHLLGTESLIAMLRRKGYTVEAVK